MKAQSKLALASLFGLAALGTITVIHNQKNDEELWYTFDQLPKEIQQLHLEAEKQEADNAAMKQCIQRITEALRR